MIVSFFENISEGIIGCLPLASGLMCHFIPAALVIGDWVDMKNISTITTIINMRLPRLGLLAILVCMVLGSLAQDVSKVRVKGHVSDTYYDKVPFYCQNGGGLYYTKDIYVKVNAKGDFDTTVTLNAPCYYKVWKNTVYLTPGDDLNINLDIENPYKTTFSGTGAAANTYLVDRKTSYLGKNGVNTKARFEQTKVTIDSATNVRQKELLQVKGLTSAFVDDAQQMLVARQASNYISYFLYSTYFKKDAEDDQFANDLKLYVKSIMGSINPLLEGFLTNNHLIDVPDVANVISDCVTYGDLSLANYQQWNECISLLHFENKLEKEKEHVTPELLKEANDRLAKLSNDEFKKGLQKRINRMATLVAGASVADMQLLDAKGKSVKLSDFKGKVIYIDFWATWCGPCKKELPHYTKLIEKFKGKNVVFLSISTDEDKAKWRSFIAKDATPSVQLFPVNLQVLSKQWQITGIPRFILINKDLSIVDAYADRPSSGEVIEKKINSLL